MFEVDCSGMSYHRLNCKRVEKTAAMYDYLNKKTPHQIIYLTGLMYGASNRARTCDLAVNSRSLCRLSY